MNKIERDLIEGFGEFLTAIKGRKSIPKKYTSRSVALDLKPKSYTPEVVKATRDLLRASQSVFAQFLGVSVKTVCAWEQGKAPSDMACRFMDEIRQSPNHWRKRLKESLCVK